MTGTARRLVLALVALTAAAALPGAGVAATEAATAAATVPADEVSRNIAERFGVEVLRVERADRGGEPIYRVIIMQPGGDSNAAFLVDTLTVDARTGQVIPPHPRGPTGYEPGAPPGAGGFAADGAAIRHRTFRD